MATVGWLTGRGEVQTGRGEVQYIGSPKQSTVTINRLTDVEYQAQQIQGDTPIISSTFPQLELTTAQIIAMTEV